MYRYWGFGLHISSQIEFPELLPAEFDKADVTIEIGVVPSHIDGSDVVKRPFSSIGKDEYLLSVRNVCRYYAGHGSRIIAEPAHGMDENSIRLFLLGTIMAAILYQRGSLPLHASAIIKDGELVLFAGPSGSGKSTLASFLGNKGYDIFTDDICVMHHNLPGKNGVWCTASYPMIKLWDDAITKLENNSYTRDFKIRPQLPKYGQFFYDRFNASPLPVSKVFILNPHGHSGEVNITRLPNTQAFKQLDAQAYKKQLIRSTSLRGVHFSLLTQLTSLAPVYDATRPGTSTTIEQLFDAIKTLL